MATTSSIDVDQLLANLKTVATGIIQQDVTTIEGYSERQLTAMAQQAKWIAAATLTGELSSDMRDFFLNTLKDSAVNFANTLKGLVMITIEKVWNALQPPFSTGSVLERRCTTVPQSVSTISTFMPSFFIAGTSRTSTTTPSLRKAEARRANSAG